MSKSRPLRWDARLEESQALAVAPFMQELADMVRAKLPEGTEFGVIVVPKGEDGNGERRVMAVTTDRERLAFYAAQWAAPILREVTRR